MKVRSLKLGNYEVNGDFVLGLAEPNKKDAFLRFL